MDGVLTKVPLRRAVTSVENQSIWWPPGKEEEIVGWWCEEMMWIVVEGEGETIHELMKAGKGGRDKENNRMGHREHTVVW